MELNSHVSTTSFHFYWKMSTGHESVMTDAGLVCVSPKLLLSVQDEVHHREHRETH